MVLSLYNYSSFQINFEKRTYDVFFSNNLGNCLITIKLIQLNLLKHDTM